MLPRAWRAEVAAVDAEAGGPGVNIAPLPLPWDRASAILATAAQASVSKYPALSTSLKSQNLRALSSQPARSRE